MYLLTTYLDFTKQSEIKFENRASQIRLLWKDHALSIMICPHNVSVQMPPD